MRRSPSRRFQARVRVCERVRDPGLGARGEWPRLDVPARRVYDRVAMAQLRFPRPPQRAELRYVREPEPIHFPEEAEVPEGKRHLVLRTFLFRLLQFALGPGHSVGSDQFVYWNARDAQRKLAPDAFVKLDVPDTSFGSWKTWERGGAPDLAVEIVSPNEGDGTPWEDKSVATTSSA